MMELIALAQECAPNVEEKVLAAIVKTESDFNPFAIGVVNGRLVRQPNNKAEAVATAQALDAAGWNYSVGLSQINKTNLPIYDLTISEAFNPCTNINVGAKIFNECHTRAQNETDNKGLAFSMALSCYYSGNFKTGFKRAANGGPSYVEKVAANLNRGEMVIPVIPKERDKEIQQPTRNGPVLLEPERTESGNGEKVGVNSTEAKADNPKIIF